MTPLLATFLSEARDLLEQASSGLLGLEQRASDEETVNALFRAVHTLKGGSGLFPFGPLTALLHAGEDVLDAVRRGDLAATGPIVDALLRMVDVASAWLDVAAETEELPKGAGAEGRALGELLRGFLRGCESASPAAGDSGAPLARVADLPEALQAAARDAGCALTVVRYAPNPEAFFAGQDPLATVLDIPELVAAAVLEPGEGWPPLADLDPHRCRVAFVALTRAHAESLRFALGDVEGVVLTPLAAADAEVPVSAPAPESRRGEDPGNAKARAGTTLKVAPEKVDAVMNLVGELVVAKNGLHYLARKTADETVARGLHAQHAMIDRIAGALQSAVMQMRMMPVGVVFQRFPRLVRDLAKDLGKRVDLHFAGEETEADRTVIERLAEPLTHLVRNGLDHGLESPSDREAHGKPQVGTLTLSAAQEGDRLVLALDDDGRGIDPKRVAAKALERGLVSPAQLATMSEAAVVDLIFAPGFSTAETISNVSGRGVGMDAVRRDVESLGGRVVLENRPGRGTTVRLIVPITMAFTRILVVKVEGERYGLPFDAVEGVMKMRADELQSVHGGRVVRWRDQLVPVLDLGTALGVPGRREATGRAVLALLVVRAGEELLAFAADAFEADLDVVVKPMSGQLAGVPGVAGTSILGDGKVLLVLDPKEVTRWVLTSPMAA